MSYNSTNSINTLVLYINEQVNLDLRSNCVKRPATNPQEVAADQSLHHRDESHPSERYKHKFKGDLHHYFNHI